MDDEVRRDWTRNEGTTPDAKRWMQTRNTYSKTCFFLVTLFQYFHSFVFFFLSVLPLLFFIFLNVILVSFLFFSSLCFIHHVYLGGENVGDTCNIAHSDVQVHVIMHAHT